MRRQGASGSFHRSFLLRLGYLPSLITSQAARTRLFASRWQSAIATGRQTINERRNPDCCPPGYGETPLRRRLRSGSPPCPVGPLVLPTATPTNKVKRRITGVYAPLRSRNHADVDAVALCDRRQGLSHAPSSRRLTYLVDPVRVEGDVILDLRHRFKWSFISPHRVA